MVSDQGYSLLIPYRGTKTDGVRHRSEMMIKVVYFSLDLLYCVDPYTFLRSWCPYVTSVSYIWKILEVVLLFLEP